MTGKEALDILEKETLSTYLLKQVLISYNEMKPEDFKGYLNALVRANVEIDQKQKAELGTLL
jgi:hypothetical protein|tara:strand:+ start:409 stop:594 length:186 start_codon:yes stop_codon:yes gene_type:complete